MTTLANSSQAEDVTVTAETETKFELDAESFDRIKTAALVKRRTDQLNVYYDCGWELAELAATFRVRFSHGTRPVVTLKIPVTHGSHRVMREFETLPQRFFGGLLPRESLRVDSQMPKEFESALAEMGISELCRVGWVRNERYVLDVDGDMLELDRLKLPDGTIVYEAEIDTPDLDIHTRLVCWIKNLAPTARPSSISKFQRFRIAVVASQHSKKDDAALLLKAGKDCRPSSSAGRPLEGAWNWRWWALRQRK